MSQNGGTDKGKLKKNRVNCAAASCGAKVLKHNDEATNAGFILSENRDQYMIQPCTAKKWFVVISIVLYCPCPLSAVFYY